MNSKESLKMKEVTLRELLDSPFLLKPKNNGTESVLIVFHDSRIATHDEYLNKFEQNHASLDC